MPLATGREIPEAGLPAASENGPKLPQAPPDSVAVAPSRIPEAAFRPAIVSVPLLKEMLTEEPTV